MSIFHAQITYSSVSTWSPHRISKPQGILKQPEFCSLLSSAARALVAKILHLPTSTIFSLVPLKSDLRINTLFILSMLRALNTPIPLSMINHIPTISFACSMMNSLYCISTLRYAQPLNSSALHFYTSLHNTLVWPSNLNRHWPILLLKLTLSHYI